MAITNLTRNVFKIAPKDFIKWILRQDRIYVSQFKILFLIKCTKIQMIWSLQLLIVMKLAKHVAALLIQIVLLALAEPQS